MRSPIMATAIAAVVLTFGVTSCEDGGPSSSPAATSKETFCGLLLSFRATNDGLDGELGSGDVARAEAAVKRMTSQVRVLQERAPADIKSDVDLVADFVIKFDLLMARYGYSVAAVEADEAAATEFMTINNDTVAASLDQLRAYGDQDCAVAATSTTATTIG